MNKESITSVIKKELSEHLETPGGILYSSHETLRPGSIYLLGFNPGGSGGMPLGESLKNMLSYNENAYLDECWRNGNGSWGPGEAPLQQRINWLLQELGAETREVCASNLIFFQSRTANDINFKLADSCWPVHEAILDIVQPKLILTFGNSGVSPYGYLYAKFGDKQEEFPSGHGNWKVKGFSCHINGRPTYVAGLPHLSRYSPVGKQDVIDWLKSHV